MGDLLSKEEILGQVKKLLDSNTNHGYSEEFQTEYWTIHPSPGTYPFQYFWDSCLHAFILTTLGESDLAARNFRSLYAMQAEDGYVGHMLYWDRLIPAVWTDAFQARFADQKRPHMTAFVQPPLSAQALHRIWYHTHDDDYLKEMLPKVKRHFDWLASHRDLDGDGLLTIFSMFESGIDWKPSMDELYCDRAQAGEELYAKVIGNDYHNFVNDYNPATAQFKVKEVAFNTIYARNLETLSLLCQKINDQDANKYDALARKVSQAIQDVMYDENDAAFWDVTTHDNSPLKTLTPTIFFPIILPSTTKAQAQIILDRHFHNKQEFATEYPLPSVAINDSSFDPEASKFLWRGPTWALYNWYVYQALYYNDFKAEAETLRSSIHKLMSQSGFREYYNPTTGEGGGAEHFTWSGLIIDMLEGETGAPHA
ncbi:MAG: amylo-alpha-1,6-glucosidase [Candidatus Saccharimonadales bacterium]